MIQRLKTMITWNIKTKLMLCISLLFAIGAVLSFSSFRGVYAYRGLVRDLSRRASEFPKSANLTRSVTQLRSTVKQSYPLSQFLNSHFNDSLFRSHNVREKLVTQLDKVDEALIEYKTLIKVHQTDSNFIGDTRDEQETVRKIERTIKRIRSIEQGANWALGDSPIVELDLELEQLENLTWELPMYLHGRMNDFAGHVRGQYRSWIAVTAITTGLATLLLLQLVRFVYKSLIKPFRVLIHGSRKVASGDFNHRTRLQTSDEMAELASAMNAMTSKFQKIRDDLDQQVKERTKEVVRQEKLASVGFLAAGVAHEINNPMASIAWCAESLEARVPELVEDRDDVDDDDLNVIQRYLKCIQEEAFRCKGITERLLDFSRMGGVDREKVDLHEATAGVIDMVRHLGKYRRKNIEFTCTDAVVARVNMQEFKQVVLNLITNALDSLDDDGKVEVALRKRGDYAELIVKDNGCGMTDEVQQHLFEPFFTQRQNGQGTGLGLSITNRIIQEHGGRIEASSDGPGKGSCFQITLPSISQGARDGKEKRAA